MKPEDNKFHLGAKDGRHYWLTPPELYDALNKEYGFDFDPCPYPKPSDFDGLTCEWGKSNYCNIPFGAIMHDGKRKGATAWVRKAIAEHKKGKRVVLVHPLDKWVFMLLEAGAKIRNLRDVKWLAIEDGKPGKGTGRWIACFVLDPPNAKSELAAPTLLSCGVESEDSTCERCGGQGWYPWYDSHEHEIQQPCEACNGTGRVAKRQPQDNAAGER